MGLIDLVLAVIIGTLLYLSMKTIYKPVSNIAHELRTPLTSILGYSQLLSLDFADEAERTTAIARIESEAKYMRDIVEHLLTMDSISGYRVERKKHDFALIVNELKTKYPLVAFDSKLDVIVGEMTLIHILLSNLIENAVREDSQVTFTADKRRIVIANPTKDLAVDDVRLMNQRRRLDDGQIKGHGIGMELCFEIVKAHDWRLEYELEEGVLRAVVYLV